MPLRISVAYWQHRDGTSRVSQGWVNTGGQGGFAIRVLPGGGDLEATGQLFTVNRILPISSSTCLLRINNASVANTQHGRIDLIPRGIYEKLKKSISR